MGGTWNLNPGENDWIDCHLDFCKAKIGMNYSQLRKNE